MNTAAPNSPAPDSRAPDSQAPDSQAPDSRAPASAVRDIAEVPAVEVVTTVALHLMSAAAVQLGLGTPEPAESGEPPSPPPAPPPGEQVDLDEARTLITALAGLVTASASRLGTFHAAPLRDGLKTLQLAFREASPIPDAPGNGPGENLTGAVLP